MIWLLRNDNSKCGNFYPSKSQYSSRAVGKILECQVVGCTETFAAERKRELHYLNYSSTMSLYRDHTFFTSARGLTRTRLETEEYQNQRGVPLPPQQLSIAKAKQYNLECQIEGCNWRFYNEVGRLQHYRQYSSDYLLYEEHSEFKENPAFNLRDVKRPLPPTADEGAAPAKRSRFSDRFSPLSEGKDGKIEHIVIVGGGVIGCCTAYYLTRHSKAAKIHITMIESTSIACGASGSNAMTDFRGWWIFGEGLASEIDVATRKTVF